MILIDGGRHRGNSMRVREGTINKYINHYAVVTKASSKIKLVQAYIIFSLPDYSSEVIERHQNLFYGRLVHLAIEFDMH